jgi:hypothetical protein
MNLTDELRHLEQLHWNGTLTDTEFTQAKALLLTPTRRALPVAAVLEVTVPDEAIQRSLEQLDRAWLLEAEQFLIGNQAGPRVIPSHPYGTRAIKVGGGLGATMLVLGLFLVNAFYGKGFIAVVGLALVVAGALFAALLLNIGIKHRNGAKRYDAAYRKYQQRRALLLASGAMS